jgi:hypothetical protein
MKKIDEKILEEIARYNSINSYITEQETALPPVPGEEELALPPAPGMEGVPPVDPNLAPAAPAAPETAAVDVATDPDVEKVEGDGTEEGTTEEMDITDLVKSQKNIESKQEEFFNTLFNHLNDLDSKLGEMDNIVNTLNNLEAKIEKLRPKTAEEKLELRSLDSGPYTTKLSDFFNDKQDDFEKTGKEYVLTTDEVQDYSPTEIKKTFRNFGDETNSFTNIR